MKNFWGGLQIFLAVINVAGISVCAWLLSRTGFSGSIVQQGATTPSIDYKDYTAILLTALGVMIAVLTLFLAIAAIWGYSQIKREATDWAKKTAKDIAEKTAKEEAGKIIPQEVAKYFLNINSTVPEEIKKYKIKLEENGDNSKDLYGEAGAEKNGTT